MTQANPFSAFQQDPFFNFGPGFFDAPVSPVSSLQSPFADLLEGEPEIAFQGALQRAGPTPNLFKQFQGQRNELFNQFQGLLDQQIRQGLTPNLRFADFIGNFDFGRQAFATPPSERPGGTSGFMPRTSFVR